MKYKIVLFDLDGTLLPMEQDRFTKSYLSKLAAHMAPHGYDPEALIRGIWESTAAMMRNDGSETNESRFWREFSARFGEKSLADQPQFEVFYHTKFDTVAADCGYTPRSRELIDALHAQGVRTVLATSPIFPAVATEHRMTWAGLCAADFELYTTYENSTYCKPNPAYYQEILTKLGADPRDCLMVGNDTGDDLPAKTLGMEVFLLTDCLINSKNIDLSLYPHGNFDDLFAFLAL